MPVATKYPSIPIHSGDLKSMGDAVNAMRQTVSLLIVNQQQPSQPTLTKASQVFATTDHVAQAISSASVAGPAGPPGKDGPPGPAGAPGTGFPDAPIDGFYYARFNRTWNKVLGLSGGVMTGSLTLVNAVFSPLPVDAANDSAAATAGVPVGGVYKNGSVLMVRVT